MDREWDIIAYRMCGTEYHMKGVNRNEIQNCYKYLNETSLWKNIYRVVCNILANLLTVFRNGYVYTTDTNKDIGIG